MRGIIDGFATKQHGLFEQNFLTRSFTRITHHVSTLNVHMVKDIANIMNAKRFFAFSPIQIRRPIHIAFDAVFCVRVSALRPLPPVNASS